MNAVWCSDDPKNPTKLCPFCFRCFCEASEKYKQEFWRKAPQRLHDELQTLSKSKDRLGDVLIRMRKLTTPQLLEALVEQKNTGKRLGEILVDRGLVKAEDIAAALRTQGVSPLTDTMGVAYAASPVWEQQRPRRHHPVHPRPGRAQGRLRRPHRAEGGRDLGQVPHRRLLLPRRPDPQAVPDGAHAEAVRALPRSTRAGDERPQTQPHHARLADVDYDLVRPDAAHRPRRQRDDQARQPRDLPQGPRPRSAWSSRTACG